MFPSDSGEGPFQLVVQNHTPLYPSGVGEGVRIEGYHPLSPRDLPPKGGCDQTSFRPNSVFHILHKNDPHKQALRDGGVLGPPTPP